MHDLDAGNVEPAGRRRSDEHDGVAGELSREHDLLQVAAGELPSGNVRAGRAHVVALHQRLGELPDLPHEQQRPA